MQELPKPVIVLRQDDGKKQASTQEKRNPSYRVKNQKWQVIPIFWVVARVLLALIYVT